MSKSNYGKIEAVSDLPADGGMRTVPALVQLLARWDAERLRDDFAARGHARAAARRTPSCWSRCSAAGRHAGSLAADLGVTRQAVAQVVATLERDGYVQRIPDPGDARAKLVCLTPRGRAALRTMRASALATEEA